MKRFSFLPLAIFLLASIFLITACSEQAAPKMETSNMTELIKTDVKLGDGTPATAGKDVSVHYLSLIHI